MAIAKKPKRDHSAAKDTMGDAVAAKFIAGADFPKKKPARKTIRKFRPPYALTAPCSNA